MARGLANIALLCAVAGFAHADGVTRDALAAAQAHGSIDELEALGAARPITPYTDDAWRSAALLAERAHDLARAERDLEQVIATASDDVTRDRARRDIERLAATTGAAGQWGTIAARHAELAETIRAGHGDPTPALRDLEALIEANSGYPAHSAAALVLAAGWEREGDAGRALQWLRVAIESASTPADRLRAQAELVLALTRLDRLDDARTALRGITDATLVRDLTARVGRVEHRHWIRQTMAALLLALAVLALVTLWRRGGLSRLRRPPGEALYYVPIAALIAIISQTGNPLVAHAVIAIAIAGAVVAWISGALLAGRAIRLTTVLVHALCATLAMIAAAYLVLDHTRLLDLVLETWRGGPAMR